MTEPLHLPLSATMPLPGGSSHADRVRVLIRLRPRHDKEHTQRISDHECVEVNEQLHQVRVLQNRQTSVFADQQQHSSSANDKDREWRCSYDQVFGQEADQQQVFGQLEPVIRQVVQGFNSTIFAYGQTGTGKTHTMLGENLEQAVDVTGTARASWGIIPRAVQTLFDEIEATKAYGSAAIVHCSFLQIYNNDILDLLQQTSHIKPSKLVSSRHHNNQAHQPPQQPSQMIQIRELVKGNAKQIFVSGLCEIRVTSVLETLRLLQLGLQHRVIRATQFNEQSSRSHVLFQLSIEMESRGVESTTILRRAKLNLVDLAGSEKWDTQVHMDDTRTKELMCINQSLSALGNVFAALTDAKRTHIPYRDSKLTRLLQDSLGGNCQTVMIATISPCENAIDETISTLQFADRAKRVMVQVQANEVVDDAVLLAQAHKEIARLKLLLKQTANDKTRQVQEELDQCQAAQSRLVLENQQLRQLVDKLQRQLSRSKEQMPPTNTSLPTNALPIVEPPKALDEPQEMLQPTSEAAASGQQKPMPTPLPVHPLRFELLATQTAATSHHKLLEEIQTERRMLEDQLIQLSARSSDRDNAADDQDLCPMCHRVIDHHTDAELDDCIEQETRLAEEQQQQQQQQQQQHKQLASCSAPQSSSVWSSSDPGKHHNDRLANSSPTAPAPAALVVSRQQVSSSSSSCSSSSSSHTLVHKFSATQLAEAVYKPPTRPIPPRKRRSVPSNVHDTSNQQEPHSKTTVPAPEPSLSALATDHQPAGAPVVHQGYRNLLNLKRFQEKSPYFQPPKPKKSIPSQQQQPIGARRCSTGDGSTRSSRRTSSVVSGLSSTSGDSEVDLDGGLLSHSVKDIGKALMVYKYRYDCWYPCTIVGFDSKKRMHCVQYEYGDKQWQILGDKQVKAMTTSADPQVE